MKKNTIFNRTKFLTTLKLASILGVLSCGNAFTASNPVTTEISSKKTNTSLNSLAKKLWDCLQSFSAQEDDSLSPEETKQIAQGLSAELRSILDSFLSKNTFIPQSNLLNSIKNMVLEFESFAQQPNISLDELKNRAISAKRYLQTIANPQKKPIKRAFKLYNQEVPEKSSTYNFTKPKSLKTIESLTPEEIKQIQLISQKFTTNLQALSNITAGGSIQDIKSSLENNCNDLREKTSLIPNNNHNYKSTFQGIITTLEEFKTNLNKLLSKKQNNSSKTNDLINFREQLNHEISKRLIILDVMAQFFK